MYWPGWKIVAPNMVIGFLAHGVYSCCAFFAFENGVPVGMVALVLALQPIATGALSGIITGEKTSKMLWLGLIIGFIGVAVSVAYRMHNDSNASLFGYLILLGSVLSISIASLIQRQMEINNAANKLKTDQTLFFQSIATAAFAFLPAVFVEQLSTDWNMKFTLSLGWLIIGVSLIAYGLMWKLIERISATKVSSLFYLGPPVTMFLAWLLLSDPIEFTDILGLVIVFFGLSLTQIDFSRYFKLPKRKIRVPSLKLQRKIKF